jgi:hypothetical protein
MRLPDWYWRVRYDVRCALFDAFVWLIERDLCFCRFHLGRWCDRLDRHFFS